MMGGVELDLRGAVMAGNEARISVTAFMGGIEIRIPQAWSLDVRISPFMGGVEDKTFQPQTPGAPVLILTGSVFMGGVEVSN
jgi:predicted membrane protein